MFSVNIKLQENSVIADADNPRCLHKRCTVSVYKQCGFSVNISYLFQVQIHTDINKSSACVSHNAFDFGMWHNVLSQACFCSIWCTMH